MSMSLFVSVVTLVFGSTVDFSGAVNERRMLGVIALLVWAGTAADAMF